MIQYLKNRLAIFVEECVTKQIDRIIAAVKSPPLDILDLASKVQLQMDLDPIIEQTVDRLKTGHTVDYERLAECIDVSEVAAHLDTSDIEVDASEVAGDISLSDLAGELDYSSLAGEIDTSNIASEVEVDADEVAEHLDYKRLARALLDAVRAGA